MASILFSERYEKLRDKGSDLVKSACLLMVLPVNLEDLPRHFLDYDTDSGLYQLPPSGKYLMLVFEKPRHGECARNLFTTLRRHTHEKEAYYNRLIGQWLTVEFVK